MLSELSDLVQPGLVVHVMAPSCGLGVSVHTVLGVLLASHSVSLFPEPCALVLTAPHVLWSMRAWMLSPFNPIRLFVTLWTVVRQAPLSTGLSRQEYWGGLPCPPPGDLPDPGIEPVSPQGSRVLYSISSCNFQSWKAWELNSGNLPVREVFSPSTTRVSLWNLSLS